MFFLGSMRFACELPAATAGKRFSLTVAYNVNCGMRVQSTRKLHFGLITTRPTIWVCRILPSNSVHPLYSKVPGLSARNVIGSRFTVLGEFWGFQAQGRNGKLGRLSTFVEPE